MYTLTLLTIGLASIRQAAIEGGDAQRVLLPYYAEEAAKHEFYLDKKHAQRLELRRQPALTWANANNYVGAVFVWTFKGRPELIGSVGSHQYKPGKSHVFREFHCLSRQQGSG